ncbi:hypothetical protein [Pontibacter cellulosilyticus]|uniref:Uncharacterized protein n=1 Tax=Pontibacter cellulosilyticus TaxID=1720253 RepID=A0A923N6V6_9BACT|nr:hypothetical protein [Pontibacter cellulosilyticus]MBC5993321.1 hypothetical protein [Pontibacter cellulosilyticus]
MSTILYILNALLLGGIIWLLYRRPGLQPIKKHLLPALGLKLLAGILLGLLYHHYYHEGDTLTFKNASLILTKYAGQNPEGYLKLILFNDFENEAFRASVPFSRLPNFSNSFFFIKLLSLLNLLTNSQYYLNSLYLSLFSFWGTTTLVATLVSHFPKYKSAAVLAFLYFPSVVFWSSGVLKDAILFGSMCWVIAAAIELAKGKLLSKVNWLLLPFLLYLFVRIKFFLAFIAIPLFLFYCLIRLLAAKANMLKSIKAQQLALLVAFSLVGTIGIYLALQYNDAFFFHNLVDTYEDILELSQARPHISFASLEPTLPSMLGNAPKAFFSAVFRPFVWESVNILYLLLSLENLLILALGLLALLSMVKNGVKEVTLLQVCFILMIVCFGVIFGLSTPNFGTLSRYRIVFLPFLVYLLLQNRYAQQLLAKLRL